MKMKGQLDSAQPMKKHKAKSKKNELKKKKQNKSEVKKQSKVKKETKNKAPVESVNKPVDVINEPVVAVKKTEAISNKTESDTSSAHTPRQRASKSLEPMTKEEQLIAINQIIKRLLLDEMTQGTALKELRVNVLGLRQDAYTQLTGVSRKTLSEIENDKGNYTAEIINKVFKPFDLKVGLVPTSSQLLAAILTN
ncbi:MAG: helix-turn-helix transcriptional regulator [Oceanospirillaceae bacterium]|nr:helix-turn-helix transcriptional regulator [Oceanospirillaceae bacterium]